MKLSICVPTFNRPNCIKNLLEFLLLEFQSIDNKCIELIIGDNSNNYQTENTCIKSQLYKSNKLTYIKNETNLGLVGNVLNLAKIAKGEFVWIIGDDDKYHQGILSNIYNVLSEENYKLIFLNHRAYFKNDSKNLQFENAIDLNKKTIYKNGKEMTLDIWKCSNTSLMLISACIYNRSTLLDCIESKKSKDLAYPLYMTFICASKGKTRIIKEIYLDSIWGDCSWNNSSWDVFLNYVPRVLLSLPSNGYNIFKTTRILFNYFLRFKKSFLRYYLKKLKKFIVNKYTSWNTKKDYQL